MERLQQLGQGLGMSTGVDEVHWLLDTALDPAGTLSDAFLGAVVRETGFDSNPLYAVLQEVIYHQGHREPGWAAQAERDQWPTFDPDARPLQLTGETIFPWMYEQHAALRPFRRPPRRSRPGPSGLRSTTSTGSPPNEVPVAAVQYYDDPYVDLDLALATSVGNLDVWITNEHLHDGLRVAGDTILPRLFDLAAGKARVTGR